MRPTACTLILGIEIMATYRIGSKALAAKSNMLTVPNLKWIGLFPSDIERYAIAKSCKIALSLHDIMKANSLLTYYETVHPDKLQWHRELRCLLELGYKAEIQALNVTTMCGNGSFLADYYLPNKLQLGLWI